MRTVTRLLLVSVALLAPGVALFAQLKSPKDLTADVALPGGGTHTYFAPHGYFNTETQVVNAFNFARRAEETQLSLPVNSLGNLILPGSYGTLTPAQRGFWLINQERVARAGVNYGSGAVGGLPLDALEANLTTISQGHANDMATNKFFAHNGTNGQSPYQRISSSTTYTGSCAQFITYAENLYVTCGSSAGVATYVVEQAIFGWLYRDGGSAWGHRRAIFIQREDNYGGSGYVNDRGLAASEGFLGVAVSSASNVTSAPCGPSFPHATFVVMMVADPAPGTFCENKYSPQADPTPVSLLYFSGAARQQQAVLSWATAWEQDNSGFSILKSSNALAWESVGFVEGNGTLNTRRDYAFTDADVRPGQTYYYKIRQRDQNGRTDDSKPIAITIERPGDQFYVYPNPSADGSFRLMAGQDTQPQLELLTLTGAAVALHPAQADAGTGEVSVTPAQPLSAGLYHVRVRDGAGRQRVLKLLVGGQ
jgi:uncharacterized protein YkwD